MLLHLSVLGGFVVPILGLAAPVAIWLLNRDRYPTLTAHAYVVFNWILSLLLYLLISTVLVLVLIGFFGYAILALLTIVYAVIGAVRASEGELWEYPGSIRFLS